MLPVLAVSVLILVALIPLTFLVSFLFAPAGVYRDLRTKVVELEARLPRKWSSDTRSVREALLKRVSDLRRRLEEFQQGDIAAVAAGHVRIISLRNVAPNSPQEGEIQEHYARLESAQAHFRGLVREIGDVFENVAPLSAEGARLGGEFRTAKLEIVDRRLPQDVLTHAQTAATYLEAISRELSTE